MIVDASNCTVNGSVPVTLSAASFPLNGSWLNVIAHVFSAVFHLPSSINILSVCGFGPYTRAVNKFDFTASSA